MAIGRTPRWAPLIGLVAATLGAAARAGVVDVPPSPALASGGAPASPVHYTYEVVHEWPHDTGAFTEGLVFRDGRLLESTGLNGHSTLREDDLDTGRVVRSVTLDAKYFGEGLTVLGGKAYQLTWRNHVGFVYDAATFRRIGEFHYPWEGWGLATDGRYLVMSDGTNTIRFLDPATFKVVRSIDVTAYGWPVERLNELEWIKGEIFANVWQTDEIVRIDPATGLVRGIIDLTGLLPAFDRAGHVDVLNGIAYDPATDRLFVTGKWWPRLFEIRLVPQAVAAQ